MTFTLNVDPKKIALRLAAVAGALAAAYVATRACVFGAGMNPEHKVFVLFDLGREANVPAYFSGLLLLSASVLLWTSDGAERAAGRREWGWRLLSAAFAFLAADETLALHEGLIKVVRSRVQVDGLLRYAWVIPYGVVTAGIGVSLLGFLARLPRRTAKLFVAAGAIYVTGAVGCEMLGGLIHQTEGRYTALYAVEVFFEESLEMSGVVLFIYAILDHLQARHPGAALSFALSSNRSE